MRIESRVDAIAAIQVFRDLYADAGFDIQPRVNKWLEKAETAYADLTDDQIVSLAIAMKNAYDRERSELPLLSAEARKTLQQIGFSFLEWKSLMFELNSRDRDAWISDLPESVREELCFVFN